MVLLVDANALYIQANRHDPRHRVVAEILRSETELLVTSELILAEADYLILDKLGVAAELAFLADVASGTFVSECLSRAELAEALGVVRGFRDLKRGLADASLVVLARRFRTNRLLTFDERAFRAVTPLQGGSFTLLPADA